MARAADPRFEVNQAVLVDVRREGLDGLRETRARVSKVFARTSDSTWRYGVEWHDVTKSGVPTKFVAGFDEWEIEAA